MKLIAAFQDQMHMQSQCCLSSWTMDWRTLWRHPICDKCGRLCSLSVRLRDFETLDCRRVRR